MTLLVIDDDVVDRRAVIRAVLALHPDATIIEASDAATGVARLEAQDIDCVLLDYHLPGRDGLEVLREIQAVRPDLPVVALTGRGGQQLAVTLMKAGARDYLDKSAITPEALDQSIRHAMTLAAAERERRALLEREQEARREAQAANRAKDEFLATLSHELRTPLNAMLGWARLLRAGNLPPEVARRAIEAIERNAIVQTKLIEDLLDISRVITGKLQVDFQPLRLTGVAAAVVDSFQHEAAVRQVALQWAVAGEESPVVGDAARLQQALANLVGNALKFTPPGGRVDVTLTFDERTARMQVRDTGAGIDPAFLPHVFERFRQGDARSTRQHGGLGLGLAIVRHLVALHDGTVRAVSDGIGRGSLFEIALPSVRGAIVPVADADARPAPLPSIRGAVVLVVDDDTDARVLMRTVLEQHGAIVREAATAAEAIAIAASSRPDVVLSDVGMPEEDGYSLVRQLRRLYPAPTVAAVAVTAFASLGDRARALEAGFDSHLAKPVDPPTLVRTVGAFYSLSLAPNPAPLR